MTAPPKLREALSIVDQHPAFVDEFRNVEDFTRRLLFPIRAGHLEIAGEAPARTLFTWSRLDFVPTRMLDLDQWSRVGPSLWLGDLVSDRGVSPRETVRSAMNHAIKAGIAEEGEPVYFYRSHSGRISSMIMRVSQ